MNREYIYVDGKAIIKDDEGNHTVNKYYDNLDEILKQENVIEFIENEIRIQEISMKRNNKNNKDKSNYYFPVIFLTFLILSIFSPVLFYLIENASLFSSINVVFFLICFTFGTVLEIFKYKKYKDDLKKEQGFKSRLVLLKRQLVKEKDKLHKLKQQKTRNEIKEENKKIKINNVEVLKEISKSLEHYYNLGYHSQEYYQAYREGILDYLLTQEDYSPDDIGLASEYFEEYPKLVKKK